MFNPNQPLPSEDTNLYQDEHVLLPGASAGPVSPDEINTLAAAEEQATRALAAAEAIAATPVVQTVRVVRRVKRRAVDLEL